jgi:hypothetical protein
MKLLVQQKPFQFVPLKKNTSSFLQWIDFKNYYFVSGRYGSSVKRKKKN